MYEVERTSFFFLTALLLLLLQFMIMVICILAVKAQDHVFIFLYILHVQSWAEPTQKNFFLSGRPNTCD